jgi:polar amino acid transport system substrate-binding protein
MRSFVSKAIVCAAISFLALPGSAQPTRVLNVGATPTAVPFNFLDTKTNSLQGVMIDITHALAKEMGFTPALQAIPFASLVPSLQTKKIDLISSAFAVNPQRSEVVDFSDILFIYGEEVIVGAADKAEYKTATDFRGKTVGVQTGTVMVEPMKNVAGVKELRMYDTMPDMIREVSLGRIDAAIGDGPVMLYNVSNTGVKGVRVANTYQKQIQIKIAIAVRKGDKALLDEVNKGIAKIKSNGTLDAILTKWKIK